MKDKYEVYENMVELKNGYRVLCTDKYNQIYDSMFNEVNIPEGVEKLNGVYIIKNDTAIVSDDMESMRRMLLDNSSKIRLKQAPNKDSVYSFPDKSEWGRYFTEREIRKGMGFIGNDTLFNTYWIASTDSMRVYKNTYSTGGNNYYEPLLAIVSYGKLGQLRFWFPLPLLDDGWKRYQGDVIASKDGRIFDMIFYSLINKPKDQIDTTKGIRIVEYVLEEKDFSHEERVKMYGKKEK